MNKYKTKFLGIKAKSQEKRISDGLESYLFYSIDPSNHE
jgi:hypothetical protein